MIFAGFVISLHVVDKVLNMSEFIDDNLDEQAYDDQMLEEVEVDDSAPIDDESVAGSELPDAMEDLPTAIDLSFACFTGHTDSVYCAAIHPLQPGVVISGTGLLI